MGPRKRAAGAGRGPPRLMMENWLLILLLMVMAVGFGGVSVAAWQASRSQESLSRKIGALRVRHARGGRCARAAVDPVLPDRDDLPAVRHRSRISLSVGAGAASARMARLHAGRALHRSSWWRATFTCGRKVRWIGVKPNSSIDRIVHRRVDRRSRPVDYDPDLPVLTTRSTRSCSGRAGRRSGRSRSVSRAARSK